MSDVSPPTRDRLADAALATFARKGYESTRVEDICQSAGIARATFYRHFSGKEDVLMALVDQLVVELDRMAADLDPVTADAAGLASLRGLVVANLAIAERWAPIVPVLSLPGGGSSPARDRTIASVTAASRRIGEAFEAGGAGASDPFIAALGITGLTDGFGHQVRTWDLALDRETVADSLTALAFRMLHPDARLPAA
jgi:AcrR family transcriptional regulator